MNAHRYAAFLGLLREDSDPLTDLVGTLEVWAGRGTNMLGETGSAGRPSSSFSIL